jgi:hypothetical protein
MGKVTKNGRTMILNSSLAKMKNVEFIPEVGDEVQFYCSWLETNVYGEVIKVKGQTVTVRDTPREYKFTLRKTGEWIEKGFQHYDRNRKLREVK